MADDEDRPRTLADAYERAGRPPFLGPALAKVGPVRLGPALPTDPEGRQRVEGMQEAVAEAVREALARRAEAVIASARAAWPHLSDAEAVARMEEFLSPITNLRIDPGGWDRNEVTLVAETPLMASGGWCAPPMPLYDLSGRVGDYPWRGWPTAVEAWLLPRWSSWERRLRLARFHLLRARAALAAAGRSLRSSAPSLDDLDSPDEDW